MDGVAVSKMCQSVLEIASGDVITNAAMKEKSGKRRVGMLMGVLRRALASAHIGTYNGEVYCWNGSIYDKLSEQEFYTLIYDAMEGLCVPYEDMFLVDRVLKACKSEVLKKDLLLNRDIVVFKNCMYDVARKMELPFQPKYVQMTKMPYAHEKDARPLLWLHFLNEVLPSADKRAVLQEFLGSIFIDRRRAKMEKMLILLGNGANGKSVVFNTVLGVLGNENVSNFGLSALIGGGERKRNTASINGKLLNYCSEIQAIEIGRDSDALKTLISGEPTDARALYGQNFMARDIPLLMANANRMPFLKDMSEGMKRRLCIIRFDVTIPKEKQDPLLSDKLKDEYPAIFNWFMEGRERFINNGYKLTFSTELESVVEQYIQERNSVLRFMASKRYFHADRNVSDALPVWKKVSHLYKGYVKYCMGERIMPETMRTFGTTLQKAGFERRRMRDGVEYAIFGEQAKVDIGGDAFEKVVRQKKDASASFWHKDGSPMIYGIDRLAYAAGVARNTIRRFLEEGKLEGCYEKAKGGWTAFDLNKCKAVFEKENIYINQQKRAYLRTERARDAQMRKAFNARMLSLNLPYRKSAHKDRLREGCVWVSDGMTVEEILAQEGKR